MSAENPHGEHGLLCACGGWVDMRDLADVLRHEHRGLPLDDAMGVKGRRADRCLVCGAEGAHNGLACPLSEPASGS